MKQIELMVLAALARESAHGYALAQRVTELGLEVRPGNLYRVLGRLERRGWVQEVDAPPAQEDARRRSFGLTPAGRRAVAAELDMYADVIAHTRGLTERPADV